VNATADSGKQDTTKATDAKGNTAVPHQGQHDRVAMLSLKADGTPDQTNPELIGDPEAAKAAAREQFTQQAVAAADHIRAQSVPMMAVGNEGEERPASEAPQDPAIAAAQAEHEKVAAAARAAADAVVDALHKDADKN
jgi:hypothetical protein